MIRRGDVCWVDLEPAEGSEANGWRPAVVVSSDQANRGATKAGRGVITVVPLTTNVTVLRPYQVGVEPGVSGLRHTSKAQVEQIRALALHRISTPPIGTLPPEVMAQIDRALRIHLAL